MSTAAGHGPGGASWGDWPGDFRQIDSGLRGRASGRLLITERDDEPSEFVAMAARGGNVGGGAPAPDLRKAARATTAGPPCEPSRAVVLGGRDCLCRVLVGGWALLHFAADRWWCATILLFTPRVIWAFGLPLLLVPVVVGRRGSWALAWLALAAGVFCWRTGTFPGDSARAGRRAAAAAGADLQLRRLALYPFELRKMIERNPARRGRLQDVVNQHVAVLFSDSGWHVRVGPRMVLASRFPVLEMEDLGGTR